MIGHSSPTREAGRLSWAIVRGDNVHFGCMTEEELTLTIQFRGDLSPGAESPCERCGIPLRETPDP